MTRDRTDGLDPAGYPQLEQFAGGYLHEDYVPEHGTPERARDAFLRDASREEREAFAREAAAFLAHASTRPWAEVRQAFARLGSAWSPRSRAALAAILSAARGAGTGPGRARTVRRRRS